MSYRLYIDLKGESNLPHGYAQPEEHVAFLASQVSHTVRGMGLMSRTPMQEEKGYWPGSCDSSTITERRDVIRLSSSWAFADQAIKAGQTITAWLLANGWRENLLNVFLTGVRPEPWVFHGEALDVIELDEKYS